MNKQEFFAAVQAGLSDLPEEDIQRAVDFYGEIIDDCMEDGMPEEDAVAAVGPVEEIISYIRADSPPHHREHPGTPSPAVHKSTQETFEVEEPFSGIWVNSPDCTVRLLPAPDGKCRVVFAHRDKSVYTVAVEHHTLTVQRQDRRGWLERLRASSSTGGELNLYLPGQVYQGLTVQTISGNVIIPQDFQFQTAAVHTVSGSVRFSAGVQEAVKVKTVSGEIAVSQLDHPTLLLTAQSVSGDITLSQIQCAVLNTASTSGDINLSTLVARDSIHIKSVSGDVKLTGCDGDTLKIKTTSGDISASLLTPKMFSAHTTSGDIHVPASTSGGACNLTTLSGDISCTIQ